MENALLVQVTAASRSSLELRLGWTAGSADTQDTCAQTTGTSADFSANPTYETDTMIGVLWAMPSLGALPYEEGIFTGTFSVDGETVTDAIFEGLFETGPIGAAMGTGPEGFCELVASSGAVCEECSTGSPYCLYMRITQLEGLEVASTVDASDECL